jgi:predicted enzyme related to lactoylglutathione lyase
MAVGGQAAPQSASPPLTRRTEAPSLAKVLGLGGVFFKSPDPAKLYRWYERWLGMSIGSEPGASFWPATMPSNGFTVWSSFDRETTYFAPSEKPFMINLVVDNLEEAIAQVAAGGAEVVGNIETYEYGKFGWFMDPDGNKVELWEPAT